MTKINHHLEDALSRAESFARARNYAGPDPYDGLTSPIAPLLRGRIPRQALMQLVKRTGVPTRRVLGVKSVQMAKSLALFAEGYSLLGQEDMADRLISRLLASQEGGPWGYEFDVQTRWAHYKAGTPNVIATAFVVRALSRHGRLSEVSKATLEWLYTLVDKRGYFHYTPTSDALIHNGNLLAAETVARLGGDFGLVRSAVDVTASQQRGDGSWTYGEGPALGWVDNFHTVYVLESLKLLNTYGVGSESVLAAGINYWSEALFTNGLPLYYAGDGAPSRDVHNVATIVGALPELLPEATTSIEQHPAVGHLLSLQGDDGGFRNSPKSVPFMRWNQAHAFRALAKISNVRIAGSETY